MFNLWKKMEHDKQLIQALWRMIAMLVFIIGLLAIGWMSAPSKITVYVPPDISTGATVKPGIIPPGVIYAFAFEIFTSLNTWSTSGESDYLVAIKNYRYYLTPHFQAQLMLDEKKKHADGSLSRVRMVTGYSGMGYSPESVKVIGKNMWEVDMRLQMVESVSGETVKNIVVDYPLRIVRVNEPTALNPWGLAIDGFVRAPSRAQTVI